MKNNNSPKVLIACPTSDHKKYCQDEWFEWLLGFNYKNKVILIVENSETPDNANEIKEKYGHRGVIVKYIGDKLIGKTLRDKLLESTIVIRDYFLDKKNEFVKWLSLESDIFIPQNSIEYLLAYDFPVIGFPYFHFSGDKTILLQMQFHNVQGTEFGDYTPVDMSFSNDIKHDLFSSYQCGIGCLMFDIKVIEKVEIRCPDTEFFGFPDYFLHVDFWKLGIKVALDPAIICIHKNSDIKWNEVKMESEL